MNETGGGAIAHSRSSARCVGYRWGGGDSSRDPGTDRIFGSGGVGGVAASGGDEGGGERNGNGADGHDGFEAEKHDHDDG